MEGTYYGIVANSNASGSPLVLEDSAGNVVFQVDGKGNVQYKGVLSTFATTARGGTARSFSPNSTEPTIEDSGTAQLVRGAAAVRLDPAFAASIEPTTGYRVVVTADGETNGLFVAGKTAAGFVVRESHAGRSTVTFDYRIVATKLGATGQHMTILDPAPRAPSRTVPSCHPLCSARAFRRRPPSRETHSRDESFKRASARRLRPRGHASIGHTRPTIETRARRFR